MTQGPNPSISGDAIGKALGQQGPTGPTATQRALDEADLRDLERAEYYGETPAMPPTASSEPTPKRSILDRLLRR